MAEMPCKRAAAWAATPGTVPVNVSAPAWAQTTSKPGRLGDDAGLRA